MGRSAAGVKGIELEDGDEVVGVISIPMTPAATPEAEGTTADPTVCLLTITENGYGKRTPVDEYRVQSEDGSMRSQSRGGKGRIDIKTSDRNGKAVAALGVHATDGVMVISKGGQIVRTAAGEIRETGRNAQGVRVVSLDEGDVVIAAARIVESGTEPQAAV
jgi:DNA gyrase subunit A